MSIDYEPYRKWLAGVPVVRSPHVPPGTAYVLNHNYIIMAARVPSRWLRLACFLTGRPTPTGWDLL